MLCGSVEIKERYPYVRDNQEIQVLECTNCNLVFLSSFDHISDSFYEESGMLSGNVDLKNYRIQSYKDDLRRAEDLSTKVLGKRILDFGCGAGGFLKLINEQVEVAVGVELDRVIRKAINEEGITCYENIDEIEGEYDVITMFHVVEHLTNPIEILQKIQKHLAPNGRLIIEVPNAEDALLTLYNNRSFADFTYWSCHTYLYNNNTLRKIVEKAGLNVKVVKQLQRYPLSNHLYWLSMGSPGGHNYYGLVDNPILNKEYESALAALGKCDTLLLEACKEN